MLSANQREKFIAFRFHGCFVLGFDDEAEQRFRVGCTDIEPPVGVFDGDAVKFEHVSVGIFFTELVENDFGIRHLGIDFAGHLEMLHATGVSVIRLFEYELGRSWVINPERGKFKFEELNQKLVKYEEITDRVEFEIASYLNEVSKSEISEESGARIKAMYKIIGEMESLGDSGEAIGRMLQRKNIHGKDFDDAMLRRLNKMMDLVDSAYEAMIENLKKKYSELNDISNATDSEIQINEYRNALREEHIVNLESNSYNYQTGVFYMDIVSELEKIGDFIINISQAELAVANE